jgi:hypothetical protein
MAGKVLARESAPKSSGCVGVTIARVRVYSTRRSIRHGETEALLGRHDRAARGRAGLACAMAQVGCQMGVQIGASIANTSRRACMALAARAAAGCGRQGWMRSAPRRRALVCRGVRGVTGSTSRPRWPCRSGLARPGDVIDPGLATFGPRNHVLGRGLVFAFVTPNAETSLAPVGHNAEYLHFVPQKSGLELQDGRPADNVDRGRAHRRVGGKWRNRRGRNARR